MNSVPLLADSFLLRNTPAGSLRKAALDQFGRLAGSLPGQTGAILRLSGEEPFARDLVWRSLVSAEILLARWSGVALDAGVVEAFSRERPFGEGGPSLGDLAKVPCACCAIPLGTDDPSTAPPFAVIWTAFDGENRLGPGDTRLSPVPDAPWKCWAVVNLPEWPHRIDGASWTLAAALARKAMETGSAREQVGMLARDWMVSGRATAHGEVERIVVGNKVNLPTDRKWLFPEANRGDLVGHVHRLRGVQFAATVDGAWARVSGRGAVEGGEVPWPEPAGVMHSFVSYAREPVLVAALLSQAERVVLWHSDENEVSQRPASEIVDILQNLLPDRRRGWIELRSISSTSLARAQRDLAEALEPDLATGRPVLFNVTQGNRLMSYAPLTLAQLHPNLWLLYRDIDAPRFRFTVVRFEGIHPVTLTTPGSPPEKGKSLDWEYLFRRPVAGEPRLSAEELWKKITARPESGTGRS